MNPSEFEEMRQFQVKDDPHPYIGSPEPVRCYSKLFNEHYIVRGCQLTFDSGVQYLDTEIAKLQGLSDKDLIAIHLAKTQFNGRITGRKDC